MVATSKPRYDVEALKRAHPIADVVARYGIELKPSGRAYVGRCPFHADEGRPNLYVYPANQSWYCYRCAMGGDALAFVMRRENVSFPAACERLAGTGGAAPPPLATAPVPERLLRWERLTLEAQVVMNSVCVLYQHLLWREPRALAYLRDRAIPDWLIRRQAVGYADGHSLETFLRRHAGLRIGEELGLLRRPSRREGGGELREFLAGRIVVPELRGGNCLWFIGRALEESAERPKYLALAGERPVLGLEQAVGRREAFLCEGVFDYLTAVAWKLPAFSPCGTHLPAGRLGFLARAETVWGVLDGDSPGREAAERFGAQIGDRWRPLPLPEGHDLNDLARLPDGRAQFFQLLANARKAEGGRATDGR
jgi:DNA primase